MFWALWYTPMERRFGFDTLGGVSVPLMVAFCDIFICLSVVLLVYNQREAVYYMSGGVGIVAALCLILSLFSLLLTDFFVCHEKQSSQQDRNQYFGGGGQDYIFILTQAVLVALTVVAILDAQLT